MVRRRYDEGKRYARSLLFIYSSLRGEVTAMYRTHVDIQSIQSKHTRLEPTEFYVFSSRLNFELYI